MSRIRLGDLLVKAGLIDELQLASALALQRQWGGKLGDVLVNNGLLDEMMLWRGLSKQLGVPLVSLPEQKLDVGIANQVPVELCTKHSIFPIHRDDKGLTVATSDPGNIGGLDEIAFRLGFRLRTVLAPDREVEWAIRRYHYGDSAPCPAPRLRRIVADAPAPAPVPAPAPPAAAAAFNGAGASTPLAELAEIIARQTQQAPLHLPPPTGSWTSPDTAPTEAEAMMRETAHLLRFLVEACVQRGLFTREGYLEKLRSL